MHVVRDHGQTVGRARGVYRPVVGADVGEIVLGAETIGRGILARRFRPGEGVPQIEDLGAGNRGFRDGVADDGGVPLERAPGGQKIEHRGGRGVAQHREGALPLATGLLQGEEHRQNAQHRVLGFPGQRPRTKEQVLVRPGPKGLETGVHPLHIGVDEFLLAGGETRHHLRGHASEPMEARALVDLDGGGTNQLGEFSRGPPPHQVHLKEAFLTVKEPGGARDVESVVSPHRGDAILIALHDHRAHETGEGEIALERRQGAADQEPEDERGQCGKGQEPQGYVSEEASSPKGSHRGVSTPGAFSRRGSGRVWATTFLQAPRRRGSACPSRRDG